MSSTDLHGPTRGCSTSSSLLTSARNDPIFVVALARRPPRAAPFRRHRRHRLNLEPLADARSHARPGARLPGRCATIVAPRNTALRRRDGAHAPRPGAARPRRRTAAHPDIDWLGITNAPPLIASRLDAANHPEDRPCSRTRRCRAELHARRARRRGGHCHSSSLIRLSAWSAAAADRRRRSSLPEHGQYQFVQADGAQDRVRLADRANRRRASSPPHATWRQAGRRAGRPLRAPTSSIQPGSEADTLAAQAQIALVADQPRRRPSTRTAALGYLEQAVPSPRIPAEQRRSTADHRCR